MFDSSEGQLPQDLGDDVVQEVLKTGTDLRQYSRQIEKELKEVENKSIQDYIKESQNIASLHNQIAACDNILEVEISVENCNLGHLPFRSAYRYAAQSTRGVRPALHLQR